jgi:predicted Zn-dependent peptidase
VTGPLAAPRRVGPAIGQQASPPFERTVLDNGMRVVSQHMPHARSVAVALFVGVGSRFEDEPQAGLSHLLEHLVFKGTRAHPVHGTLSEAIESCGGSANASTDHELTVYSSRVPRAQAARGLEVVAELALRPLLRQADLAAEKPVIVDEIRMYVDSPSDHVFSIFDQLLFGRHPLGREIAGTPRSVRRATRGAVVEHWQRWYRPDNLVLAVAGAIGHDEVVRAADAWWDASTVSWLATETDSAAGTHRLLIPKPQPGNEPPVFSPPGSVRLDYRRLAQANLCLGMPGVSRDDPDRWTLDLLAAVLGDGMGSRLFLELRERRSLAYDVSTFASTFADCGTFGINAGFDPDQADRVVTAILEQLERVIQEPVTAAELERARAYTRGRLELRMEETGSVAAWLGTGEMLLPRILTFEEVIDKLEAVTSEDLLRVARRLIRPDQARLAMLAPLRGSSRFERMLAA